MHGVSSLLLVGLAIAGPAIGSQAQEVLGLVRSESGRAVAGATVRFLPDPASDLAYAGWLDSPPEPTTSSTDANGRFRFGTMQGGGCLFIEHPDGLGAVIPRVWPGNAVPVVARELGSVWLDDATAVDADGGSNRGSDAPASMSIRLLRGLEPSVWLGVRVANEVRLPAGSYLVLIEVDRAIVERRVEVHAGRRTIIAPPSPDARIRRIPDGAEARLKRWPELRLGDAHRELPSLAGPDVLRWTYRAAETRRIFAETWVSNDAPVMPPAAPDGRWTQLRIEDREGTAIADATVMTVEDRPGGPVVVAVADGDGAAWWSPVTPLERTFVVVRANGFASAAVPSVSCPPVIQLAVATRFALRIEGPHGEPVGDAEVHVRIGASGLLDHTIHADGRGVVTLSHEPATPIAIDVRSNEYLPLTTELVPVNGALTTVQLESGATIHGFARISDAEVGSQVEIELRDPSGQLGVAPRTVVAGDDGSFEFRGLPDGTYTLFAQTRRGGRTWSAKLRGVQPSPDELRIDLRDEDPAPPGAGTRKN